jgi:N-methylhydantoinase A
MTYRLGVDVGGTFTDLLLVDEEAGKTFTAKVPSTPEDSSIGVLNGIERVTGLAGVEASGISHVMHGTTVATNTVLTGTGARVGLVTTQGYRQTLQIARSFVPGGLGGWVIYNKSLPLAPLELTVEAIERVGAKGDMVEPLNEDDMRAKLRFLKGKDIEALTVSLINSFANDASELRIRELAAEEMPGIPVSLSSEVVPEMQEYERTVTTVANSYVRPRVATYIESLQTELARTMSDVQLHILRSDGGLASASVAESLPVNLLMSGPAGGVSGAIWIARQAGFENLLTLDMGGTSADVALVQNGEARLRRETTVGDHTVRASSVDIRTVGAGGGSIAHVPELTRALRVGPESAGADPGPACYAAGGDQPTVTDANVVLGYLPESALLGGDMALDKGLAEKAVQTVADSLDLPLNKAAAGIVDIVNENMFGALRLVSVEQGHDPREFALIAFGGAGPLHGNALGRLMGSWPVIIPPGPGVLCAYGDAATRSRVHYQVDVRYHGQGLLLTIDVTREALERDDLDAIAVPFDRLHEQLFTFALEADKELVNVRAVAQGQASLADAPAIAQGSRDPSDAAMGSQRVFMEGADMEATIYDRNLLKSGNAIEGPAIVVEMDSTTVILPDHTGAVDTFGNILIRPSNQGNQT